MATVGPPVPEIGALAPWFGSNRLLAKQVGKLLEGCEWVGVPFAGGMCELPFVRARTTLVSDLHGHVLNLAQVVARPLMKDALVRDLEQFPFHFEVLRQAQFECVRKEEKADQEWFGKEGCGGLPEPDLQWARAYFVAVWMSRSGTAGTKNEFNGNLSTRWNAGGGDSVTRYRSAIQALDVWHVVLQKCGFVRLDVFHFLDRVEDKPEHAIYLDQPFPDVGVQYKWGFTELETKALASTVTALKRCRIICRFHDHPLVRHLYPEELWRWHLFEGRDQHNVGTPEVLLERRRE